MFRSAFLRREYSSRPILLSVLVHVIAVTEMILHPSFPFGSSPPIVEEDAAMMRERTVLYYSMKDLLPAIAPPKPTRPAAPAPKPAAARAPVRVAFSRAQAIVSQPPKPDNSRQTIVQPDIAPLVIRQDIRIPNLVSWSVPVAPLPPSPTIAAIRRPAPPLPAPPKAVPVTLAIPAPPKAESLLADLSAVPVAPVPITEAPRLPVPVRITAAAPKLKQAVVKEPALRAAPPEPAMLASVVKLEAMPSQLPNLVALSVTHAPPPQEDIAVPPGQRAGEFAASPEGTSAAGSGLPATGPGASVSANASAGAGEAAFDVQQVADLRLPGISVSGGTPPERPSPLRAGPSAERSGDDLRQLMARASLPDVTRPAIKERSVESEFFGTRRVYTVTMNMPNLTSGSGSWVLRFAELEQRQNARGEAEPLATPEAIRKVDPMYVAAAVREKIQGNVTLAAVVLKDGTVANIRVVGSLDPRLDASAVSALTQWRFRPAQRGGQPLDLEVLVQIPFRLASF